MDAEAARRARSRAIKADLADATTDEEACPPEWVDLTMQIRDGADEISRRVAEETQRFADEPDVRVAIERRERVRADVERRVRELNTSVRRLNLIAPLPRFQRLALDAEEFVRPLYTTPRRV